MRHDIADHPIEKLPPGLPNRLRVETSGSGATEYIQTHISHLLLTSERVYKIRKAVRFSFLSFATRAERNQDCLREVKLNRRLAPNVYLGVAPLIETDETFEVGPVAETLWSGSNCGDVPEHCVVMTRLPTRGDAQSLLEDHRLTADHVEAIADRIAAFHIENTLGCPAPYRANEWISRIASPIIETLDTIIDRTPDRETAEIASRLLASSKSWLEAHSDVLDVRRSQGRAVDGHGDLQLAHVWFSGSGFNPLIIDCTEFNEEFRRIDAASEVAFLAMDLCYRGEDRLGERFLARYARETDDFGLYHVVDYYAAYRASVRGKVAVLAALDQELPLAQRAAAQRSALSHLNLAERFLTSKARGSVTIMCGSVGSGKSSVATELAEILSGVMVSSDRTRKHLAGMRHDDHSAGGNDVGAGLYERSRTDEVYSALLERAEAVLDSGRNVILDASFARVDLRSAVRSWAESRGISLRLVFATCSAKVALERLAKRERDGHDPSDAGPGLHQWSIDNFEYPDEWPSQDMVKVETDDPSWRTRLTQTFGRIRLGPLPKTETPKGI